MNMFLYLHVGGVPHHRVSRATTPSALHGRHRVVLVTAGAGRAVRLYLRPDAVARDRREQQATELSREQAVDGEIDGTVDGHQQLADIVQIEDEVPTAVRLRIAHEVEHGERRLTHDGDDDDEDQEERDFGRRPRHRRVLDVFGFLLAHIDGAQNPSREQNERQKRQHDQHYVHQIRLVHDLVRVATSKHRPYLTQVRVRFVVVTQNVRGEVVVLGTGAVVANVQGGGVGVVITEQRGVPVRLGPALLFHDGVFKNTRRIERHDGYDDADNVQPCPGDGPHVGHFVRPAHGPESVGGDENHEPDGTHVGGRSHNPDVADVRPGAPEVRTLPRVAAGVRQRVGHEHRGQQHEVRARERLDERRGRGAAVLLERRERQRVAHHTQDAGHAADDAPQHEVEQVAVSHGD